MPRGGGAGTVLVLILVVAPLAGCLANADESSDASAFADETPFEPVRAELLSDPTGDARDLHSGAAHGLTDDLCQLDPCDPVEETVMEDPALWVGGVEAPPSMDIVGGSVSTTADGLEVRLDVAALDEALTGLVDYEDTYGSFLTIFWGQPCYYQTALTVNRLNGRTHLDSAFITSHETCTSPDGGQGELCAVRGACWWHVPFEVVPGSPGAIVWHVPWHLVPDEPSATVLEPVTASTARIGFAEGPSAGVYLGPASTDTYYSAYIVDTSRAHTELTLTPGPRVWPPATDRLSWTPTFLSEDEPVEDPTVDLRRTSLIETPTHLEINVTIGEVRDVPVEERVMVVLGLAGGWGLEILIEPSDGERRISTSLDRIDGEPPRSVPVALDIQTGSPGNVVVRMLRSDLPPLLAGDRLGTTAAYLWDIDHERTELAAGYRLEHWATATGATSSSGAGPAYWFQYDTAAPVEAAELVLADDSGDVTAPDTPDPSFEPDRFDIVSVSARAADAETSRLVLTTASVPASEAPTSYHAVFYAFGVQTPSGTVMAGYYKARDTPGGTFLCARDTTVLTETPADPTNAAWTTIEGFVSSGGSARDGSSSGDGSITLLVPNACFGGETGEPVNVDRLVAATYLVRNLAGQPGAGDVVGPLDVLEGDEPFTIAAATPTSGFWAQPFGVDDFWDIAGIVLAVLTVLATALIVVRRRRALRRYLAELTRLEALHADDPETLASALVALRHRLQDDLMRHRISENHYPIVADRLRARITGARIQSLGDTYYELPGSLARRIERVLDDGRLTPNEHRVIAGLVGASGLAEARTESVLARLGRWVSEDAAERT